MPRSRRKQSEGDYYHVFSRGVGRQFLFEDDKDRVAFLNDLGELLDRHAGRILAWVLMGNHFHLLLVMPLDTLSVFMKDLQARYAQRYNKKYDHAGHVFQGRFGSQAITSDEQLMACVRYIHRNPIEGNLSKTCDYKWSSYREYLQGAAVTDTDFVIRLFGGLDSFVDFHKPWDDKRFFFIDVDGPEAQSKLRGFLDEQGQKTAAMLLGDEWREAIGDLPKAERDSWLRQLKEAGLSVRQIERLTGIGRNIISRA